MFNQEISFISGKEKLVGEIVLPTKEGPHPAVLLIGGTLSDTRDGDPAPSLRGEMPTHGLLRIIAQRLAQAGIASFRWDKRGVGASTGKHRHLYSDVWTDVEDAEQALYTLRDQPEIDKQRLAILGESAGGYFACFLAQRTDLPTAYILQGALYSSIPDMLAFNYQPMIDYAARGPKEAAWIKKVAYRAYQRGLHYAQMIEAVEQGATFYQTEELQISLWRLKQELDHPPAKQFHFIQKPTLVIQGDKDMNVPPEDCYKIAKTIRASGNREVTLVVVPGADHSMQLAPADQKTRWKERVTMESFHRPYAENFFHSLTKWLEENL